MFSKILIANRGEIACRIMDTAKLMGIRTVAVYSDADRESWHVANADEAVHIGPSPVAESYLQGSRIIEAAKKTGAEAIHPGFGFLSENPDFVEAVEAAGLIFIGPSASSMRAMGLKDAAKALMEEAGVPIVPGYHGSEQAPDFLQKQADQIGYPVLIKARAGGGGKGMRKVEAASEFASALESAKREAAASFGDDRVLIEKYIQSPRHIEVQVFGDSHGSIVHLYERDCSLQRRHQKVIEEAPAPGMTDALRTAMTNAAVKAAQAIEYEGAGTIEFIVDGSRMDEDHFWFMEMNTRLQVEHPVTEMIIGVDLVEWQLRVASGEALPLSQDEIDIDGHAFEARLYAEDAANDFLPATGTLSYLRFSDNARIETGVRESDTITAFYDPMIAKVVSHGTTRQEALQALDQALSETRIVGSVTNLSFLSALARHEGFRKGDVDTGLIARDYETLIGNASPDIIHKALACLIFSNVFDGNRDTFIQTLGSWQLWGAPEWPLELVGPSGEFKARIKKLGASFFDVCVEDEKINFKAQQGGGIGNILVDQDGYQTTYSYVVTGGDVTVFDGAKAYTFSEKRSFGTGGDEGGGSNRIIAPMPGLVTAIHRQAGDIVAKGDPILVMEAMKMEHALEAQMDGVISELSVKAGEQVEKGMILAVLEGQE